MKFIFKSLWKKRLRGPLRAEIDRRIKLAIDDRLTELEARQRRLEAAQAPPSPPPVSWQSNIFLPPPDLFGAEDDAPFMPFSTCAASDFLHPRYAALRDVLTIPQLFNRKHWEWVFILNAAMKHDLAGKRALGFGVGKEPLSSAFAKLGATVVATDAPSEVSLRRGWTNVTATPADATKRLFKPAIVGQEQFERSVRFEECDMNAIGPHLRGFDFCWSSCSLEHLGSLQHGIDFINNSLETLKFGGVACHTTEFNLSSNTDTVESGGSVLYRKRDLDALVADLRARGHQVDDIRIAPNSHFLDGYVDTPPFSSEPHLKLALQGFVATSLGLAITRGR